MQRRIRQWALALAALVALGPWQMASADAPGQSFWTPGQAAAFTGLPANAGWTVELQPYFYSGDENRTVYYGQLYGTNLGYETDVRVLQTTVQYGFKDTGGGRVTLGFTTGYGTRDTTLTSPGFTVESSASGLTSFNPFASIAWRSGSSHYKLYGMFGVPTGGYDGERLSNISLGHTALDVGGAYTYFDRASGTEASVLAGATYNWENSEWRKVGNRWVPYTNGTNWHVDFSYSKFVSPHWSIGAAGYVYGQFGKDELDGVELPDSTHIAGFGPQATYVFRVNGRDWTANLRGYWEFSSKFHPEGYGVFATISMPLGTF